MQNCPSGVISIWGEGGVGIKRSSFSSREVWDGVRGMEDTTDMGFFRRGFEEFK